MLKRILPVIVVLALAALIAGCPKNIPQPEIDAAEQAMADIEDTKDCAPETYQAAKTMMDRARALLKEERYEEAKTALIAAKQLAEKAQKECDEKKAAELAAQKEPEPEPVAKEVEIEKDTGPDRMVTVYFGFNEATLTDESRTALNNNAEYLRNHEGQRIQVEGHCDSRGSTEYNLALGERRAMAVRKYLVKLGVDPKRLEIISYGEERPVDPAQNEDAWSQNRRAEFMELR
jgi:peptidoglycan-associated lipoprotein